MNINVNIDPSDRYTKRLIAMLSAEVAAKFEEVKASIAAENSQVKAGIDGLKTQIDDLKAQIQAGMDQAALLAALDGLKSGVEGIYTPDPVAVPEDQTQILEPPSEPVA